MATVNYLAIVRLVSGFKVLFCDKEKSAARQGGERFYPDSTSSSLVAGSFSPHVSGNFVVDSVPEILRLRTDKPAGLVHLNQGICEAYAGLVLKSGSRWLVAMQRFLSPMHG